MVDTLARFGTVPITMIRRSGDSTTDWQPEYLSTTFHFLGSNRNETQTNGQGTIRLATTVRLQDEAVFAQFLALVHTRQTLRMDYDATAFAGDRSGSEFGEPYKEFDNVFLTQPENIRLRLGGKIDVDVVLEREPPQ
jgi:hypothetical protein